MFPLIKHKSYDQLLPHTHIMVAVINYA